jgi:hypothetical protein
MRNTLLIDNKEVPLDATISIRWHNDSSGKGIPTLYLNGKRVTKAWEIVFSHYEKEDPNGGNANTN